MCTSDQPQADIGMSPTSKSSEFQDFLTPCCEQAPEYAKADSKIPLAFPLFEPSRRAENLGADAGNDLAWLEADGVEGADPDPFRFDWQLR